MESSNQLVPVASPAFLPLGGGNAYCKSTLQGGEDGESMLPLGYSQNVEGISHV